MDREICSSSVRRGEGMTLTRYTVKYPSNNNHNAVYRLPSLQHNKCVAKPGCDVDKHGPILFLPVETNGGRFFFPWAIESLFLFPSPCRAFHPTLPAPRC